LTPVKVADIGEHSSAGPTRIKDRIGRVQQWGMEMLGGLA
jgi:hypothetical protein